MSSFRVFYPSQTVQTLPWKLGTWKAWTRRHCGLELCSTRNTNIVHSHSPFGFQGNKHFSLWLSRPCILEVSGFWHDSVLEIIATVTWCQCCYGAKSIKKPHQATLKFIGNMYHMIAHVLRKIAHFKKKFNTCGNPGLCQWEERHMFWAEMIEQVSQPLRGSEQVSSLSRVIY